MGNPVLSRKSAGSKLRADIIKQIEEGKLTPGDQIPSAADLADSYRISYVTAHKAIKRLADEGYCVRKGGQGTFVSDNPTQITSVGIPAYFQENPFLAHMIEELTLEAASRNIAAVVGRAERTPDFIARLVRRDVKAMIRFPGGLDGAHMSETDVWQLLQTEGIRTVMINDFWREGGPFPHVRTDEAAGITEMMDHLVSLGHRRIMLVMESAVGARSGAARAHYDAALRHDLAPEECPVIPLFPLWWKAKEKVVPMMLEQVTAAIVIYDLYALELMEEFKRLGVVLGRDFSLAGFDGVAEAEACGLTTVVQPVQKLVSTAFQLLNDAKTSVTPKLRLKPTCVFRGSTGPAPKRA